MSYLEYYELDREPFSNAPVSSFYFNSSAHSQALARLTYAVSQSKGLALLTGEAGTGKTTLARRLLDSLPEHLYEASLLVVIHSGITPGWLLRRFAVNLGVQNPADEKLALIGQLYERLVTIHEEGRRAVILIDEAQMLQTRDIMEEFRGLLNLELPEQKLLTVVLFGLPETEQHLRLDPPLFQRIAVRVRLGPLGPDATGAYITHRLRLAGATRMPFSAEAVEAIHRVTEGTPRLINTLCDNCLFEGFLSRAALVSEQLVAQTAGNLGMAPGIPDVGAAPMAKGPKAKASNPIGPELDKILPADPLAATAGVSPELGDLERFLAGTDEV